MRVKVKDPKKVVYCAEQGKVVHGKKAVDVKVTSTIREAIAEGLIIEVSEPAKVEVVEETKEVKAAKDAKEAKAIKAKEAEDKKAAAILAAANK